MTNELRYKSIAARLALLAMIPVCAVWALDDFDEDSLFAQEDLMLNEAVEGSLPDDVAGNDDFLGELLGDDGFDDDLGDDFAFDDLFGDETSDAFDDFEDEPLPQPLDDVVNGIRADADEDAFDAFPLDDGFDADSVLDEMMAVGDVEEDQEDDWDELAEPTEDDLDFDSMLGEMAGDEPVHETVTPDHDDDLDFDLDEFAGVEDDVFEVADEEKGVVHDEDDADDLGFLFDLDDPVQEDPVAPVEADEPDMMADEPDMDLDALFADDLDDIDAPVDLAVEDDPMPVDDVPEIDEEPVVAEAIPEEEDDLVELAEEPAAPDFDDPLALDDDLFSELASETRRQMREEPTSVQPAPTQPAEVAADPFVDRPGDLDAGVEPETPAPVVSIPAAPPLPEGAIALEEAERLRRQAQEYQARNTLTSAHQALRDENFRRAIELYQQALDTLPRRPDMERLRSDARRGLGTAYYRQALSLERMEDYENARIAAQNAVRQGHSRAEQAVVRIQGKIDAPPPPPPVPPSHRWEESEYQTVQSQVRSWLRRGREAYLTGEYDRAILAFESVLARDPENKEAIRLMRSAANKKYDRSTMELNATAARMMATVRDTWNPRQYGLHEEPIRGDGRMVTDRQQDEIQRMAILEKMENIRIPEVDFRQANIRDVVNFLFQQSAEFDPEPDPDRRRGVNIILNLDADQAGPAPTAPADPFAPAAAAATGAASETLVTFSARDITLKEALDIVVDIAGLKYLIRGNVVMVMPRDAAVGEIVHRMYDVLPSAILRLQELSSAVVGGGQAGGRRGGAGDFLSLDPTGSTGGEDVDLKTFFQEMGVEWPARSSIKFVRGLGKLVVANTLENLTVFEKVLSILNVVPYQIEIEARFIEVAQTDVDSLGLEWLLTDNWQIAQKRGSGDQPLASRQRIQMNANAGQGGFTAGNRFLSDAGLQGPSGVRIVDEIASFSSVLTNPELTMVLHALQQRGHTDLLSAPKVTTQSGQQAVIKVVTEYIYPTEFETSGIGGDTGGGAVGAQGGAVVGAVVTPRDFTTREVGVILEVLPEVSPEGQMINLTLSPEVVSEPTWRNYGSTYTSFDPNGNPVTQTLNMEQPFFHTRKLQTNLLIYNGATVVMGGMITEVRTKVDDKIPLLGDIPILGRLFRSQYESSEKRNLLIFVTARLVDPAGRPLDRDALEMDSDLVERIAAPDAR